MSKLKKIALATTIGLSTTLTLGLADPYFNGAASMKDKNVIVKPVGIELNAPAWVSMNFRTGDIVSEKNMDVRREPASLTKIMTAYVVANELKNGNIKATDMVTISHQAHITGGSKMFLREGSSVSVENLLTGLIVDSGNDAAVALAEYIAGTPEKFAEIMNQTAQSLGMTNTHFINPNGLPGKGEEYTTAHDMATLARNFIYRFPDTYQIFKINSFTWEGIKQYNRNNKLLTTFKGADGMKTGHTDAAGYCLVASAKQDGERYVTAVLGTSSSNMREQESARLLRYSLNNYDNILMYTANTPVIISADVIKNAAKGQELKVVYDKNIYKSVPKNYVKHLKQGIELDSNLTAPIQKGQNVGNLVVTVGNSQEIIAKVPVVALNNIKVAGWW